MNVAQMTLNVRNLCYKQSVSNEYLSRPAAPMSCIVKRERREVVVARLLGLGRAVLWLEGPWKSPEIPILDWFWLSMGCLEPATGCLGLVLGRPGSVLGRLGLVLGSHALQEGPRWATEAQ